MNSYLETNPARSFRPQNDTVNLRRAYELGASLSEGFNWVKAQLLSLLVEHGPVQSTRQQPFNYRIDLSAGAPRVYAYFPDETGENFGDQHRSFLNIESEYLAVQQGWSSVVALLSDSQSEAGAGVFWISPMKFYLKPRLSGDKPSTYDVLNFYQIVERTDKEIIAHCQTIKLDGPLTPQQHKILLHWHDHARWLPPEPTEETVVSAPVRFRLYGDSLDKHFAALNLFIQTHSEFGWKIAGDADTEVRQLILNKISPYIQIFHQLLIEGAGHKVNDLIWRLVKTIKGEDAQRQGLDPRYVWRNFIAGLAFAVHPLTGENLGIFKDPFTGGWLGGDQCGGGVPKEKSEPYCDHCHKHHPEGECPKTKQ